MSGGEEGTGAADAARTGGTGARVLREDAGPYEIVHLDTGVLRVSAIPALGGRILSARFGGHELLYRNRRLLDDDLRPRPGVRPGPHDGPMSAWLNWGGDKTWPAPQGWGGPGAWAGPPDPVLDSGAYELTVDRAEAAAGAAGFTLTSAIDPRTGLRLRRRISAAAGEAAYRLDLVATNESASPVRWALWNVTQVPGAAPGAHPSGGVYVGLAGGGAAPTIGLVAGTGTPVAHAHTPGVLRVPHQDVVGKIGFPDASGWLAYVSERGTLTQRFAVDGTAAYPDRGSRAEVWLEHPVDEPLEHLGGLAPNERIVECEVLGPWQWLAPGESTRLTVECGFGPAVGAVEEVTGAGFRAVGESGGGEVFVPFRDGSAGPPNGPA
ncbi:DUF4380 domain-containing protein [Yinghuangia sp. ASG 101]|uniref:DUF4380 domain-containing protein n=1 Tax=Yinghuangia sp. ASG 101 TaxID=2896848 RepID=UPI001E46E358|nr:DUF4380 domain-containing protein [Yinghuangia sp. ASG 101]UGQ09247.1 DUF4380 domain-containing protein [Yinghuangia sp. ASG 101]